MTSAFRHVKGEEQDRAAGSRKARTIRLATGETALASIGFNRIGYRKYAYLRYKADGRTYSKFVARESGHDRATALKAAWDEAKRKGLVKEITITSGRRRRKS